ncbi:hypothetical protein [Streptomyces xanthophaeus]|uniref:hypothetical protein n=1 Tax=Streptomyces xanthophaeus TaxID=67385 RepID=UPI0026499AB2|nr:hypothetical protein [Streptomyces xanthophaeus]WKD34572.1 hypothetical protein KO717_23270 [Streptomyces xanthophaeus]
MSNRPRRPLWWFMGGAGLVLALLVALPVAFLADLGEDRESPLAATDVEGTWQGSDGGRLTVRADGSADLEGVTRPGQDCGQSTDAAGRSYTGPAAWVFDTYPDERPGIRFDYQGPATGKPCKVYLVVFSQEDGTKGFLPQDPPEVSYVRPAAQQG